MDSTMPRRIGDSEKLSDLVKDTEEVSGSGFEPKPGRPQNPSYDPVLLTLNSGSNSPSDSGLHLLPDHGLLSSSSCPSQYLQSFSLLGGGGRGRGESPISPCEDRTYYPWALCLDFQLISHTQPQGERWVSLPCHQGSSNCCWTVCESTHPFTNPWVTRMFLRLSHLHSFKWTGPH